MTKPKSGWPRVRFGDVVRLNTDRSADPAADGIERYVAIEHIEPEDLRIRSWGLVAEGTTFTQRIRPGQTLFVKRRAYQRKVAVAEFDAVCSGDIYVLEPKDNRLLPELLPFLCQTDAFFEHAVNTSAGSLSPRTNWTQLAQYEFTLPPLAEQRRIAGVLNSIEAAIDAYLDAFQQSNQLLEATAKELFGAISEKVPNRKLADLLQIPVSNGIFRTKSEFGTGIHLVNVTDIYQSFRIPLTRLDLVPVSEKEYDRFSAKPNDVIFNRSSLVESGIGHAALVPDTERRLVFECHLMRARPDPNLLYGPYLARYALSVYGRRHFLSCAQTTTMTTIGQDDLNSLVVPTPDLNTQQEIASVLDDIENATAYQLRRKENLLTLKKHQLQVLEGG